MSSNTMAAAAKAAKKWDSDDMNEVGVTAVNRALSILEAFSPNKPVLSLAELAQYTGLYKSTILRLIGSLEAFAYLHKNVDGKYTLGVAPLGLSAIYQAHVQPSELILSALRELVEITTESASFYVTSNRQRLCAYRVNSVRSIRDHVQVGQLLPLDKGAAGVVLQAYAGRKGARFNAVRKTGFAISMGERDAEVAAIAAPVFSHGMQMNGFQLEGALCISGPVSRFTKDKVESVKKVLLQQAKELTLTLGGRIPDKGDALMVHG